MISAIILSAQRRRFFLFRTTEKINTAFVETSTRPGPTRLIATRARGERIVTKTSAAAPLISAKGCSLSDSTGFVYGAATLERERRGSRRVGRSSEPCGLAFINPLTLSASDSCTRAPAHARAFTSSIHACIINRNAFGAIGGVSAEPQILRPGGRTPGVEYFRTDAH